MKRITIAAILVILIWLIFLTYNEFKPNKEGWKCSTVECTNFITSQEWVNRNCFLLNNQEVCRVNINNLEQVIPLQNINLSVVRQCIELKCVEEIKIRNVSYNINI